MNLLKTIFVFIFFSSSIAMALEDAAVVQPPKESESWATVRDGCKLQYYGATANDTWTWSGKCKNGYIEGCGVLAYWPGSLYERQSEGCWVKGIKHGKIKESDVHGDGTVNITVYDHGKYVPDTFRVEQREPSKTYKEKMKLQAESEATTREQARGLAAMIEEGKRFKEERAIKDAEEERAREARAGQAFAAVLGAVAAGTIANRQAKTDQRIAATSNRHQSASSGSGGGRISLQQCHQKIVAIHSELAAVQQANRGNDAVVMQAMNLSNQRQKSLFEGDCSHHPQAREYVAAAEANLGSMSNSSSGVAGQSQSNQSYSGSSGGDSKFIRRDECVRAIITPPNDSSGRKGLKFINSCGEPLYVSWCDMTGGVCDTTWGNYVEANSSYATWLYKKANDGVSFKACRIPAGRRGLGSCK